MSDIGIKLGSKVLLLCDSICKCPFLLCQCIQMCFQFHQECSRTSTCFVGENTCSSNITRFYVWDKVFMYEYNLREQTKTKGTKNEGVCKFEIFYNYRFYEKRKAFFHYSFSLKGMLSNHKHNLIHPNTSAWEIFDLMSKTRKSDVATKYSST